MRTIKRILVVFLIIGGLVSFSVAATATNPVDKAAADIRQIGESGKYAFVVFHRSDDGMVAVRETVEKALEESNGRAELVEVDMADTANATTVREYGANRAPIPLVLAIAPNGAVTGGFYLWWGWRRFRAGHRWMPVEPPRLWRWEGLVSR